MQTVLAQPVSTTIQDGRVGARQTGLTALPKVEDSRMETLNTHYAKLLEIGLILVRERPSESETMLGRKRKWSCCTMFRV